MAHLDHVHIFKKRKVLGAHDLCDHWESRGFFGLQKKIQALLMESLESIGGGPGLEGPSP